MLSQSGRLLFERISSTEVSGDVENWDAAAAEELCALGLAEWDGDILRAISPRAALTARASDLARRRDDVLALADELADTWDRLHHSPQVDSLIGDDAGRAVRQLVREARGQIDAMSINPEPAGGQLSKVPMPPISRAVQVRAIYDAAVMGDPGGVAIVRASVEEGEVARVLPQVPMTMFVADREVTAVLPPYERWDSRVLLLTRAPGLVQVMSGIFELLWGLAIEVRASAWAATSANPGGEVGDDRVLLLMAAGLSDPAIARELGISERTLSRRIAALQQRLGAKTRFQLGYQAAQAAEHSR
ncbi:helix-turn-helix transcriptional regulator [Nocardioides sp. GXZ039]|uniref:helix-turn-helix transcriptional regulator n=1 Tax=Nocardioides sp. GXZ039 TaxID=3136018 RepID=UPI0030F41EB4